MKKNYVLAACLFLAAPFLHAQVAADETKKTPYIEVNGSAEMEIVPDEIYIQVTLQERYNGKEKITMEKQDALFISGMQSLNIDTKDISLADAQSDFSSYKWKKEDALARKSYVVLVHDAA
ncbi:MAG: hypothetical protein WBP31_04490, partial [Chitinophagales bacterium]